MITTLKDWALSILTSADLESKLQVPVSLQDNVLYDPIFIDKPSRASHLQFSRRSKEDKLPAFHSHGLLDHRAQCLHRFLGHELMAVELIAFAICAYPNAPTRLRQAWAHQLKEEQQHVRWYQQRLQEMGYEAGSFNFYTHFWVHTPYLHSPSHFLSFLNLTLEQANLDFAPMYRDSFLKAGDEASSQIMQKIIEDEINHVKLGVHWLSKLHPQEQNESLYTIWTQHLPEKVEPKRARGFVMHVDGRRAAGIDENWLQKLAQEDKVWIENNKPIQRNVKKNNPQHHLKILLNP